MQALLDVANPVNSLSSLQLFYNTIEGNIQGLAALEKSEDSYGALLIPIILGKLPTDIQRNLAREHGSLEWTLKRFETRYTKGNQSTRIWPIH